MRKYLLLAIVPLVLLLSIFTLGEKQIPASLFVSPEISSPGDWVKEEQIKVYPNQVILNIEGASWTTFTDTNSMDPFLDAESNAIEVMPKAPEEIEVGDIISYQTDYGVIIHRVVERGIDKEGIYYLVKGDNNSSVDPGKVRFEQVKGVLVAIIY
ncbi:MAG: S26 family signal peptidase [Candidatus Woesearchaeota archaeon]